MAPRNDFGPVVVGPLIFLPPMPVLFRYCWLLAALLLGEVAAAQTAPGPAPRPPRPGTAPSRGAQPSAYRNQPGTSPVAPPAAPAMSAQDRQAYENCPDPRRFGPKPRAKKLVRIW